MTKVAALKLKAGNRVEAVKGVFRGQVSTVVDVRTDGGDIVIETDLDGQMVFFPDEVRKLA